MLHEAVALVIIALAPGLMGLAAAAGLDGGKWLAAAVGGGGWILAYVLRVPVTLIAGRVLESGQLLVLLLALSGIVEEGVRFLLIRWLRREEGVDIRKVLSLGLGWGVAEALLIYVAYIPLAMLRGYSYAEMLPGAVERVVATCFHTLVSLIVACAVLRSSLATLLGAMALHSGFNAVGVAAAATLRRLWLVEATLATTLLVPLTAAILCLRYLRGYGQGLSSAKSYTSAEEKEHVGAGI